VGTSYRIDRPRPGATKWRLVSVLVSFTPVQRRPPSCTRVRLRSSRTAPTIDEYVSTDLLSGLRVKPLAGSNPAASATVTRALPHSPAGWRRNDGRNDQRDHHGKGDKVVPSRLASRGHDRQPLKQPRDVLPDGLSEEIPGDLLAPVAREHPHFAFVGIKLRVQVERRRVAGEHLVGFGADVPVAARELVDPARLAAQ
jgi:hypothetical protein